MDTKKTGSYLLLGAIAFLFLSIGLWEIIDPNHWAGFVPPYVTARFSDVLALTRIHGFVLVVIGAGIASVRFTKYAALAGTLVLMQINLDLFISAGFNDLLLRDLVLMMATGALALERWR